MHKIRILLAEDHTLVREGIRELISGQDDIEIVGEAANGEEAVFLTGKVKPDVVLMDIAMPGINGIEATRQIKRSFPSVGVLVLTAHNSQELILGVIDAGAAGYLLKDVRAGELLNAIRAVYDGESVLHPAIAYEVFNNLLSTKQSKPAIKNGGNNLTARELEVLRMAADGLNNEHLAAKLSVGARTVQTHWRNIFNKLGVSSRTEAVIYCLRNGWIVFDQDSASKTALKGE